MQSITFLDVNGGLLQAIRESLAKIRNFFDLLTPLPKLNFGWCP